MEHRFRVKAPPLIGWRRSNYWRVYGLSAESVVSHTADRPRATAPIPAIRMYDYRLPYGTAFIITLNIIKIAAQIQYRTVHVRNKRIIYIGRLDYGTIP